MTQSSDMRIVVVGAGGHAKVLIELLRADGWSVVACTDSDPTPRTVLGVPVVGSDDELARLRREGLGNAFIALGANRIREKVGRQVKALGFALPPAISPQAIVSPTAQVGEGVAIMAGTVINAASRLSDLAIVNTRASVDHDGVIGVAAHIGPGSVLAGCVTVGDRSFLGAGCVVIPDITIGSDVIAGAGSVLVRDVPDQIKVYGVPARPRT